MLSLDGGAVKGVVTMQMLEEWKKMIEARKHQMFDLIAGTSTEAVVAR